MIHVSSMAARTLFASVIVHASVAVALVGGVHGTKAGHPSAAIGDQEHEAVEYAVASPEEPGPEVIPEQRAAQEDIVVPVAAKAAQARAETSLHPAQVLRVNREGQTEGDDAPDVVVAQPGAKARFVMAFGTGATVTGGLAKSAGDGEDETATYMESGVSSRARLLQGTPPEYPPAARAAAVEADLPLEIVVDARGEVVDARLLKHAGYGLDEAALRAVRGYHFIPAQRAGHGVSVRMRWVVDFRLD